MSGEPPAHVFVHVSGKAYQVHVGEFGQPVRWLANAGIMRYEAATNRHHCLGPPVGVKTEGGMMLSEDKTLREANVVSGQHVWVTLRGEREA